MPVAKNSKAELQIRVWSRRGVVQGGVGDERQRIDIPSEQLEMTGANVRLMITAFLMAEARLGMH